MKIKNELIKIKNGKNILEFTNLILDAYLQEFAKAQMSVNNLNQSGYQKLLKYCLLKFDEPLEFDETSDLPNETFDICLMDIAQVNQIGKEQQISIQYNYIFNPNSYIYNYKDHSRSGLNISDFYGKKITAIGWNDWWTPTMQGNYTPVKAILDVSSYNLYLQDKQEFSVTRKDTISTDALFFSPTNKITYPVHLAPNNIENIYSREIGIWQYWDETAYPVIYSVGLGNTPTEIIQEYVINDSEVFMNNKGNKIIISNIPNFASVARTFLPKFLPFYPTRNMNYKYLILKYKIWQRLNDSSGDNITTENIDTGYYYYMSLPLDSKGRKKVTIKYERS